jgi:hypothetical protein
MTDGEIEPSESARGAETVAERAAFLTNQAGEGKDSPDRRRRLAAGLAAAAHAGARGTGRGARAGQDWLAAQVAAMAPRLRARDQATLRAQYPGLGTEDLAVALIEDAARASAAVGGAVGTWAMLPLLPILPAEVAAETLAAVGIEIKLVAELHEVYGMAAAGSPAEQMTAYAGAWANRRAVTTGPDGVTAAVASRQTGRLVRRLAFRAVKTALSFGPLFFGALFGARLNRRETRRIGRAIRSDLRRRARTPASGQ